MTEKHYKLHSRLHEHHKQARPLCYITICITLFGSSTVSIGREPRGRFAPPPPPTSSLLFCPLGLMKQCSHSKVIHSVFIRKGYNYNSLYVHSVSLNFFLSEETGGK